MLPDDSFWMKWARDIAQRSTCSKIKVGSVLVKDHRLLGVGYNGTPSGHENCCDHYKSKTFTNNEAFLADHAKFSERYELHSEQNCIIDTLKRGVNVDGATLYTTWSPCAACAKVIIMAGIKRVVYVNEYKREPLEFLAQYVLLDRMAPVEDDMKEPDYREHAPGDTVGHRLLIAAGLFIGLAIGTGLGAWIVGVV